MLWLAEYHKVSEQAYKDPFIGRGGAPQPPFRDRPDRCDHYYCSHHTSNTLRLLCCSSGRLGGP